MSPLEERAAALVALAVVVVALEFVARHGRGTGGLGRYRRRRNRPPQGL